MSREETTPSVELGIRWMPVRSVATEVIPAQALLAVVGADADGTYQVNWPSANSQTGLLVNGATMIAPGEYGQAHNDFPCAVLCDLTGWTPAVGDQCGSETNSWQVHKGQTGYRVGGGDASAGLVNVVDKAEETVGGMSFVNSEDNAGAFPNLSAFIPTLFIVDGTGGLAVHKDPATGQATLFSLPASALIGGIVTAGAQTFAGNKAFTGTIFATNIYFPTYQFQPPKNHNKPLATITTNVASLAAPVFTSPALAAGGSLSSGVPYFYVITALTDAGETTQCLAETTATPSGGNLKIVLGWVAVPNATGYVIYRSIVSGTYNSSSLLHTVSSGATVTYTDDGTVSLTVGSPPGSNTALYGGNVLQLSVYDATGSTENILLYMDGTDGYRLVLQNVASTTLPAYAIYYHTTATLRTGAWGTDPVGNEVSGGIITAIGSGGITGTVP